MAEAKGQQRGQVDARGEGGEDAKAKDVARPRSE